MPVEVRGRAGWWWAWNDVFDNLVREVGPHAFTVYCCLIRHGDADGKSFPSQSTLATECRMARNTIKTAIEKLASKGYIEVHHSISENSAYCNNRYTVMRGVGQEMTKGWSRDDQGVGQEMSTKKTHIKKTHKEDPSLGVSFDQFYAAYPRKIAKPNALKAWKKLKPDTELQRKIAVALKAQCSAWSNRLQHDPKFDKGFIPHPATWLNAGRWEDEVEEYAPTKNSKSEHGGQYREL